MFNIFETRTLQIHYYSTPLFFVHFIAGVFFIDNVIRQLTGNGKQAQTHIQV